MRTLARCLAAVAALAALASCGGSTNKCHTDPECVQTCVVDGTPQGECTAACQTCDEATPEHLTQRGRARRIAPMSSPFYSPADATRESVAHIAEAAKQINPQLAAGQRVFHVPLGLARGIAEELTKSGWIVTEKTHQSDPEGMRTLVLAQGAA